MKALILSDIHSNIYALEAIWSLERDSDMIACTGDLVDYGPFPQEVIAWVRDRKVQCTQGNHDSWVAKVYQSEEFLEGVPESERTWAHHNASLLDEEDISFLESLPKNLILRVDGVQYGMAHLYQDYNEITNLYAFHQFCDRTFSGGRNPDFTRLILGHTHRQGIHYLSDEVLWLNPGSVSYRRPDDPDQTAHYATIINGRISLKRLAYDLTPLRQKIQGILLQESEIQAAERFFGERTP